MKQGHSRPPPRTVGELPNRRFSLARPRTTTLRPASHDRGPAASVRHFGDRTFQHREVHRFRQVSVEPRLSAAQEIFLHPESTDRNGTDSRGGVNSPHHVDARAVGQPNITDQQFAWIGRRLAECGIDATDNTYAMTACDQRFAKSLRRILMVFDQQNVEETMRCYRATL